MRKQNAWDLNLIPGYDNSIELTQINASELSPQEFEQKYWQTNTPVLIKGAIKHWPAVEKWLDPAYLSSQLGNFEVTAQRSPASENAATEVTLTGEKMETTLMDFITSASAEHSDPMWLFGPMVTQKSKKIEHQALPNMSLFSQAFSRLGDLDVGEFSFLPTSGHARMYPDWRVFFYRDSFTDWHSHPSDSHLMCQVVGDKEVLMVPPNLGCKSIKPVKDSVENVYTADVKAYPNYAAIKPYKILVEAGDALHIPIYWYHVVQPTTSTMGITLVRAFSSPLYVNGDLRFEQSKDLIRNLPWFFKPLAIVAVIWSLLRRNKPMLVL